MEENKNKTSFKRLLDRLQEDSWQLELFISGFVIIGLFYALDPISHKLLLAQYDNNMFYVYFLVIVHFSLKVFIFNLLLHILLRGMWIGSLGLRYVFGDIDFDKLNYSDKFTKYLRKKIGSFDSYIERLENICSVIFALTFLLVFYVFSFFTISYLLLAFNSQIPDYLVYIIRLIYILFSIGAILTLVDFITQGLLKKNKWVAKIYFPFYWVFSFLTLSFLYRPLVYNLLDNKYGRRISFSLIPIYIIIYIIFNLQYQKSNFISQDINKLSNSSIANASNYQEAIDEDKNIFIGDFAIQSKVITEPYIKLIIPLNNKIEDELMEFNPSLKPKRDKRGLRFRSEISLVINKKDKESFNNEYIRTFERKYRFKIDTTLYKTEFVISNINNQLSFESYIGLEDLSEGKHTIELESLINKDKDSIISIRTIPFWYYKK